MTVTPVTDTTVPFDSRELSAERENEREKNKRKIEKDRTRKKEREREREPHTKADFASSPLSFTQSRIITRAHGLGRGRFAGTRE